MTCKKTWWELPKMDAMWEPMLRKITQFADVVLTSNNAHTLHGVADRPA